MRQGAHKHQFAAWRTVPAGHQPVDRHRALGEPQDPDDKPIPSRHLQAHRIEQPADVRDGTGPGRPAPARTAAPRVANTANVRAEGVRQIRALDRGDHTGVAMPEAPVDHELVGSLEAAELTILTCWAEAAETLAASPDQLSTILDDARAGAVWRRLFGVGEPSADLASALEDLARMVASGTPTAGAVLAATDERPSGGDYGHLVRAVLRSKLGWARAGSLRRRRGCGAGHDHFRVIPRPCSRPGARRLLCWRGRLRESASCNAAARTRLRPGRSAARRRWHG